jgi:hypothetical protein
VIALDSVLLKRIFELLGLEWDQRTSVPLLPDRIELENVVFGETEQRAITELKFFLYPARNGVLRLDNNRDLWGSYTYSKRRIEHVPQKPREGALLLRMPWSRSTGCKTVRVCGHIGLWLS